MPTRNHSSAVRLRRNPETPTLLQFMLSGGRGETYAVAANIGADCSCEECLCCAAFAMRQLLMYRTRGRK